MQLLDAFGCLDLHFGWYVSLGPGLGRQDEDSRAELRKLVLEASEDADGPPSMQHPLNRLKYVSIPLCKSHETMQNTMWYSDYIWLFWEYIC